MTGYVMGRSPVLVAAFFDVEEELFVAGKDGFRYTGGRGEISEKKFLYPIDKKRGKMGIR